MTEKLTFRFEPQSARAHAAPFLAASTHMQVIYILLNYYYTVNMPLSKIAGVMLAVGIVVGAVGGFGFSFLNTNKDLSTNDYTIEFLTYEETISDLRKEIESYQKTISNLREDLFKANIKKYDIQRELTNTKRELEVLKMKLEFDKIMDELKNNISPYLEVGSFPVEDVARFPTENVGKFETEIDKFEVTIMQFNTGEIKEFPVEEIEKFKTEIENFKGTVLDFKQLVEKFPIEEIETFKTEIVHLETEIDKFEVTIMEFETGEIKEFPVEEIADFNVNVGRFEELIIEFKALIETP